ncbi:MAG TPA: tetratricopeptide repeat protein [Pirellulales bacterium]|nr:tetratricopeptide repeat protein [Pirellulales bacterium]
MGFLQKLFGKREPPACRCYERALACERKADHAGALLALDEAIRLDGEYCDAYWVRGMVHEITQSYDKALADLQAAHKLKPSTVDCIEINFNKKPVRVLRMGPRFTDPRAVALKNRALQNDMARVCRTKGIAAYDQQEFARAITDFTEALGHNQDWQSYCERGRTYFYLGQFKEASADLKQAVALAPQVDGLSPANLQLLAGCHYFLGNSYREIGDFEGAVSALTNSIRLAPDVPDSYQDRAQAYRALGDTKRAAADERKAQQLSG